MPWYRGIAPAYLTLFIWAPFFDQLWAADLPRAGLGWLLGSALLGSLICFGLYFAAASWGLKARRPLVVLAASTFGAVGSEWLCGLAIAFASVVWYAVAINFAVESTFLGLRACGLIVPSNVAPWTTGPLEIKRPVFWGTALFWIYITRQAIRLRLPGVVVGLMKVYSPIAVLLLTATAVWRLPMLWSGTGGEHAAAQLASGLVRAPSPVGVVPMMVGFFAMSGLLSVDWGAAVRTRKDIISAGLPCVLATAALSSILSLVVVMETVSGLTGDGALSTGRQDPMPFSFRWAIFEGRETFPAGAAAAILILFGLAALAPAVSSLNKVSEGISTHWPSFTLRVNTVIAGVAALFLMATYQVDRLGPIFIAMGAVFAPALGALAGDLTGRISRGLAFRRGVNPAGVLAWAAGCSVAVASGVVTITQPEAPAWLEQGSIFGFVVAACAYRVLARMGLEPPVAPGGDGKTDE